MVTEKNLTVIFEKNPVLVGDNGTSGSVFDYDKGILTADEGGVWGKPLEGLSVRKDDIYVIGDYTYSDWQSYRNLHQVRRLSNSHKGLQNQSLTASQNARF